MNIELKKWRIKGRRVHVAGEGRREEEGGRTFIENEGKRKGGNLLQTKTRLRKTMKKEIKMSNRKERGGGGGGR